MVDIGLLGLGKIFGTKGQANNVFEDINLQVLKGEIIAVRGDNGSGKTTLLNIIAGIEFPTKGEVIFTMAGEKQPRIGYVQQDYTSSLLPWFDVMENIAIPLRINGVSKPKRCDRVKGLLDSLGFNLPEFGYPHELSGGQKQKVAVARSLIHEPHLLILDEPFANLDAHTSRELEQSLSRIHQKTRPTVLYVSHDLDHCIYLADRVLLLDGHPSRFVAEFQVSLPRPRTREMIFSPRYSEVRSCILAKEEKLYARNS